jgi:uncharacterized protein DUF6174
MPRARDARNFGMRHRQKGLRRSIVLYALVSCALLACDSTRAVSDADRAALAAHESQWAARSFHSYSFDYSEQQLGSSYNVQITVLDDTLSSVIDKQTGEPPTVPHNWPTIDVLFNEADFAVDQDYITVSLDYDDQYGYLTLFTETSSNSGGQGFIARVSNLQPIE